jgi:hypothetical protein
MDQHGVTDLNLSPPHDDGFFFFFFFFDEVGDGKIKLVCLTRVTLAVSIILMLEENHLYIHQLQLAG